MLPSLMVIDDFLADAHSARRKALALDFDASTKKGNYPGTLSRQRLPIDGLDASIARIIGTGVAAADNTSHLHCRLTSKGDKGVSGVHVDPCFYSGILFLSRDEDCRGGTDFFRHRRTGLEQVPRDPAKLAASGYSDPNALIEDVVNTDTTKPSKWERTMRVPARFNRLILFSPWMFHNAGPGFGSNRETSRLVCLMFFAAAKG